MTEMNGIARSDLERLSAFLDGELSRAEADQLEAHLATDRQLSGALEALRATSEVVGSLPEIHPPRSFALTPEMVRPRRAYPILQFSTAMAALGFVLVIGADLLVGNAAGGSPQAPVQSFFAADQLTEQQLGESAPAAAEAPADPEAPAMEGSIAEEAEGSAAEPETDTGQGVSDSDTEGLFRSEDAADEFAGESDLSGAEDELEFSGDSAIEQEPAGGAESAEQEALKAAADEELLAGRLAASELEPLTEDSSDSLTALRMIEIGLAAALIVLIGLTLWVRQRG